MDVFKGPQKVQGCVGLQKENLHLQFFFAKSRYLTSRRKQDKEYKKFERCKIKLPKSPLQSILGLAACSDGYLWQSKSLNRTWRYVVS